MPKKIVNVFISYSRVDASLVTPVVKLLRANQSLVFQDIDNIQPGREWRKEIVKGLANSRLVIVFWCDHSQSSKEVAREWKTALRLKKDLLPLLLDDTPLPEKLSAFQGIDFRALVATSHPVTGSLNQAESVIAPRREVPEPGCAYFPSPSSPSRSLERKKRSSARRGLRLLAATAVVVLGTSLGLLMYLGQHPKDLPRQIAVPEIETKIVGTLSPREVNIMIDELEKRLQKPGLRKPESEAVLREMEFLKEQLRNLEFLKEQLREMELRKIELREKQLREKQLREKQLRENRSLIKVAIPLCFALLCLVVMGGLMWRWSRMAKRERSKFDVQEDQPIDRSIIDRIEESQHPRVSIDHSIDHAIHEQRSLVLAHHIEGEIAKRIGLDDTVFDAPLSSMPHASSLPD
jgi:TIR domain